jgi:type IV pilus assembly protein PilW
MKNQQGFSLVEIFIALAVGIALFAGVLSVFVGMRTTTEETSSYGELQENGRFALSLLSDDLSKQNYWGDYTGSLDLSMLNAVPGAPTNECTGEGLNNGTFPVAIGHFRTLWGDTAASASILTCIDDAKIASDVIQIKRAISNPLLVTDSNNFYIASSQSEAEIFTSAAIPVITNSRVWQYQHHIYYIKEEAQGNNTVPVLMQGRLTRQMSFDPIVDGIEVIKFMYGIDTDIPDTTGYGIVDTFVSADNMTDMQWDNGNNNRILSIRVYVLARSVLPDRKYTNTNSYQMGDVKLTYNDNYRRLLFNATVTLHNAGADSWP